MCGSRRSAAPGPDAPPRDVDDPDVRAFVINDGQHRRRIGSVESPRRCERLEPHIVIYRCRQRGEDVAAGLSTT